MTHAAPTKAQTALLPPFEGLSPDAIHVPKNAAECEEAARTITAAGMAGFDTESKPTFAPGEKSKGPHVVQFALADRAFIFQIHRPGCRETVCALLNSEAVQKVGFGLKNDHSQMRANLGADLRGIIDLDQVFRKHGYTRQIGVRAAVGVILQRSFPKSKRVTTSNWAARELSNSQLLYAANDAFAALRVMQALETTGPLSPP